MTDLQCPARVFLARHGEAEYETELFMDHGGSLTARGRAQARELGESLWTERISRVVVSPRDPQKVYVAALGHAFGPNPERGGGAHGHSTDNQYE